MLKRFLHWNLNALFHIIDGAGIILSDVFAVFELSIAIHEETAVLINIANHIVSLTYLRKIKALDILIIRNDENLNFILIVSPHYS